MKLIPYDPRFLDQIREIDASAAQQLEFNKDVFVTTATLSVSDEEETLYGFSYISLGTLNYGVFNLNAELGADPSYEDAFEVLEALTEALKDAFTRLRPQIPHEKVYLTAWAAEGRKTYREFLEYQGFYKNRSMVSLEKDLSQTETETAKSLTIRTPEGDLAEAKIREIDVKDPEIRAAYLKAHGQGFGFPESEEGLIFRTEHWKARVYAVVKADEPEKVLAAVTVWPRRNGRCATEDIFCVPDWRRQYLTQELLKTVHLKLKEEGFLYAGMTAFTCNKEALKLYEKLGYVKKDKVFEYIWP